MARAKSVSSNLISVLLIFAFLASMYVQSAYAYSNSSYGFSMTPPTGWTVDEGVSGTVVLFYGPTMPETGTNVNINVVVGSTNQTLSQAISAVKVDLPAELTNYTLVSESSPNINGLNCYELVYTHSLDENDFKVKQVFFIENGHDYVISCTATPSNYDTYSSAFEQSLQTFQLSSSSPGSFPPWIILVVVAVVVVVIVVAFVFLRKKPKSERLQSISPPAPPPPP